MSSTSTLPTIICATARLARALQKHQQQQLAKNNLQWHTPQVLTLQQFLADFMQQVLLASEISPETLPLLPLSPVTEKMLWQQAIQNALSKHELAALFDVASLADSAMEANQLLIEWQVSDEALDAYFQSTETRQFLRWRRDFQQLCARHKTLEPARLLALQIACVQSTNLNLAAKIELAGFDRITPLEQHLIDVLSAKGVAIQFVQPKLEAVSAQQMSYENMDAECRAAVAWARQTLSQHPQANLAIITPVLGNIRAKLADLLDDTFHPETLHPSQYEAPRVYDFALGLTLSEHALIANALNLMRLQANIHAASQASVSELLLDVNWGNLRELDARSLLDAKMRKQLPRNINLNYLKKLAEKQNNLQNNLSNFLAHLNLMQNAQKSWQKKQKPSIWVAQFTDFLTILNWANTRSLSSFEHQARESWLEVLQQFSPLDALFGAISAADAVHKLTQMCAAKMFQPESLGAVRIQVLGMFETSAMPLDGAWILGMNDQRWPPPAKPNPLLPIHLQRDFKMPNADTDIQTAFAQKVHARIISSAQNCVFSCSRKDADRELRPSPLLNLVPFADAILPISTLAETLATPTKMQLLEDSVAPPILAEEKLRGGSKLFETQAICPAWTFYQYRLGATALQAPVDGLDSMQRGNLLHAVLEHFWLQCKDSNTLKSYSNSELNDALQASIHAASSHANLSEFVPKQVIEIEKQRLQTLLETWLDLEKQRADFTVEKCEADFPLPIEGLEIKLRIDRIDALEDGGLIVIDYKTGATQPNHTNWADDRITAPQLPLYASLALKNKQVVAACFAKVNVFECKFSGLAQDAILPEVKPFDNLASNSKFKAFENWQSLLAHWQKSLTAIALEIRTGAAGVTFVKEADLLYCEVKPLLRLPERELQFEQQHEQ